MKKAIKEAIVAKSTKEKKSSKLSKKVEASKLKVEESNKNVEIKSSSKQIYKKKIIPVSDKPDSSTSASPLIKKLCHVKKPQSAYLIFYLDMINQMNKSKDEAIGQMDLMLKTKLIGN